MNLNPFNFQQAPQWGVDAKRHLKNMAEAQKAEANNGKFYTTKYEGKLRTAKNWWKPPAPRTSVGGCGPTRASAARLLCKSSLRTP